MSEPVIKISCISNICSYHRILISFRKISIFQIMELVVLFLGKSLQVMKIEAKQASRPLNRFFQPRIEP